MNDRYYIKWKIDMIKIYYKWKYVEHIDLDNNENNQREFFWYFIRKNNIKIINKRLPKLDSYNKTLRVNWYIMEWF